MDREVKHLFIVNPKSFWHKWKMDSVLDKIRAFFNASGSCNYEVYISRFPRDAIGYIMQTRRALSYETLLRVYAVGGDGILFDCLNGVMGHSSVELGAIPYGRTNNFIRGFGKKNKSLFRDIARQVAAPVIPLDVIHNQNNYAINYCAVGMAALSILNAKNILKSIDEGGPVAQWLGRRLFRQLYYMAGIIACFDQEMIRQHYEVTIDGEDFSGQYRGIFVANGPCYGNGSVPVPPAMPDDGRLNIILARSTSPMRIVSLLPAYLRGRQDKYPGDFILKQARKIKIRAQDPVLISLDDLTFFNDDFTIEVMPAVVRFIDAAGQGYMGIAHE